MSYRKRMAACTFFFLLGCAALGSRLTHAEEPPYRFPDPHSGADPRFLYKRPVLWFAQCDGPDGSGLTFGGQDQASEDGQGHTLIKEGSAWKPIVEELRKKNVLQAHHDRLWALRVRLKNGLAVARRIYFEGLEPADEAAKAKTAASSLTDALSKDLAELCSQLEQLKNLEAYEKGQAQAALALLAPAKARIAALGAEMQKGLTAELLKQWAQDQIALEMAAEALDAEPGAMALSALCYDPGTKLYVLFGGDHLDFQSNDTWVFDPAKRRWMQRHPKAWPAPRCNHKLESAGPGKVKLSEGIVYTSDESYLSAQYKLLKDSEWIYDVATDTWSGSGKPSEVSRTYRIGAYHPDYYLQGPKPNAAAFEAKLKALPVNTWVNTEVPYRTKPCRDWGTASIDPDHDVMLRWSGGHSSYDGTEVTHYHFATNRWEFAYPTEMPPGYIYASGPRPQGWNLNHRPWMTGHTYHHWTYDPLSKRMINAGHPAFFFTYDPEVADWDARGSKPPVMSNPNNCLYVNVLASSSKGVICWTYEATFYQCDMKALNWQPLKVTGDKPPGSQTDSSCMAYDTKRDRMLFLTADRYEGPYQGQVYELDLKTSSVKALNPVNKQAGAALVARTDRSCYDPDNDILWLACSQKDLKTPDRFVGYDCAKNEFVSLAAGFTKVMGGMGLRPAVPYGYSSGIVFDAKRHLLWGVDTAGYVTVMRFDRGKSDIKPLEAPASPAK